MHRHLVVIRLVLLWLPASVLAQGTRLPPLEDVRLFLGYSIVPGGSSVQEPTHGGYGYEEGTRHGWNIGLAGQAKRWLGIAFDASGHYMPVEVGVGSIDSIVPSKLEVGNASRYMFLAGPQLVLTSELPVRPFARALLGVSHYRLGLDPGHGLVGRDPNATQTNFAYGAGGGVDLNVRANVSVRLVQVDFLRLVDQEKPVNLYDYRKPNQTRWSFGLVFGF